MQTDSQVTSISTKALWAGRILTTLSALFLLMNGVATLFKPEQVIEGTAKLGYPESVITPLGVVLTLSTIIYVIPRTAALGAILLTGYLGGAVATHVRAGDGWFSIMFPVFIGALVWGGLYFRDELLRALIPTTTQPAPTSKKMLWAGRILSALPVLLLLFSAVMKLAKPAQVVQEFARLGYQEQAAFGIGILELACAVVYLIPRTSILGAILLAGYLGGATATHVRIGDPFIMPILVGVLVWGGLYFRDERLRALIPLRS